MRIICKDCGNDLDCSTKIQDTYYRMELEPLEDLNLDELVIRVEPCRVCCNKTSIFLRGFKITLEENEEFNNLKLTI
jgi:hypothetical protein